MKIKELKKRLAGCPDRGEVFISDGLLVITYSERLIPNAPRYYKVAITVDLSPQKAGDEEKEDE